VSDLKNDGYADMWRQVVWKFKTTLKVYPSWKYV